MDDVLDAFVEINKVPTHIYAWGKWIKEPFEHEKEIIIFLTGNPGSPTFYIEFLTNLYNKLDRKIPIWIIGQAGHDEPSPASIYRIPILDGNEDKFDLTAQLKHKLTFIETYVPDHVRIHLIGHSLGAWMILKLLKIPRLKNQLQKCYLLFPHIERLGMTRNGLMVLCFFWPFFFIFRYIIKLFDRLPRFIRVIILKFHLRLNDIPKTFLNRFLIFLKPTILECFMFLEKQKLWCVNELDIEVIEKNLDILKVYYGAKDGWAPISYYDELKERLPEIDASLDEYGISSFFMFNEAQQMSIILGNWIRQFSVSLRE